MVALLRGVNVGGRGKLAMSDLREICAGCGYDDVKTYIQSGNVVFSTSARSTAVVEKKLADAIAAATDVSPAVMVRTRAELEKAMAANPFLQRGEDPNHLHVTFTSGTAKAELTLKDLDRYLPEEVAAIGHQIYFYLPDGLGNSKLAADFARQKSTPGTSRNWRTVTKLLEMADDIA
ncbi:MAG: hypothetical protein JWL73_2359 [Actinomycetia bacterium]|nr:hypothetical protein [Actinomycetes bacterium]